MSITLYPTAERFTHLSNLVNQPSHWRALSEPDHPWEKTVADFTGRLYQLKGVPFKYLVPDSSMLPPESMRFFWVDYNWLATLCDGALSLGRIGSLDTLHDQAMQSISMRRAEHKTLNLRRFHFGLEATDEPTQPLIFGGFLLRSALVSRYGKLFWQQPAQLSWTHT